jgi:hypothetical protein
VDAYVDSWGNIRDRSIRYRNFYILMTVIANSTEHLLQLVDNRNVVCACFVWTGKVSEDQQKLLIVVWIGKVYEDQQKLLSVVWTVKVSEDQQKLLIVVWTGKVSEDQQKLLIAVWTGRYLKISRNY